MHVIHAPVPAAAEAAASAASQTVAAGGLAPVREKHARSERPSGYAFGNPRALASIAAVGLEGNLSEASSASSQKRRTSKNPKAKNIEKSCSYMQNENVPPVFKQYKIQGNAINLYNLTYFLRL